MGVIMKKTFMAAMVAVMGMSSVPVLADAPAEEEAASELVAVHEDQTFVLEAAKNNLLSQKAARIAVLNARNTKVQALALLDLAEHVNYTEGIEALAGKFGVAMPTGLAPVVEVLVQRLSNLSGSRFDRTYLHIVIEAHRFDVANLSQALLSQDAEVKAFAARNLPILRGHLQAAEQILQSLPAE